MSANTITTIVAMVESLPDTVQLQVEEHLRHYIQSLQDEARWDSLFETTQPQLIAAARRAKQEIATGKADLLNYDKL